MVDFMKLGMLMIKIGRSIDDINWDLRCQRNGMLFADKHTNYVFESAVFCLFFDVSEVLTSLHQAKNVQLAVVK